MKYIYCPSYAFIFIALHFLKDSGNTAVLTADDGLVRACHTRGIPTFRIEPFVKTRFGIFDWMSIISRKRYFDDLVDRLKIKRSDELIIASITGDPTIWYFAKIWSRRAIVKFLDVEEISELDTVLNRGSHLYRLTAPNTLGWSYFILQKGLGVDLAIYDHARFRYDIGLGPRFLSENDVERVEFHSLAEIVSMSLVDFAYEVGNFDHLLISGYPAVLGNLKRPSSLMDIYRELLTQVPGVAVKLHPSVVHKPYSYKRFTDVLGPIRLLPSYLPAELLIRNAGRTVISEQSTALAFVSLFEGIKAVSILDMLEYKDHKAELKIFAKDRLSKMSDGRVVFVTSVSELMRVIM